MINSHSHKDNFDRSYQMVRPLRGLSFVGYLIPAIGFFSPSLAARFLLFVFSITGRKAKHFREDNLLTAAKRSFVKANGKKIRTYQWGLSDKKVLLLHGWQSRGTALRYFVPSLLESGFEIVAMDAPGHGESEGWTMILPTYAEAIKAVDATNGPFQAAIAHSFGCRALTYAIAFSKHDWKINKIVMLSVPSSLSRIFSEFFERAKIPTRIAWLAREKATNILRQPLEHSEIFNLGHKLTSDILIIHDDEDKVVPLWEAQKINDALPGSKLIITHGLGHFKLAKDPEIWRSVKEFIANE
jgi:pimeloyl-ACP methyl ester carboxylesterase